MGSVFGISKLAVSQQEQGAESDAKKEGDCCKRFGKKRRSGHVFRIKYLRAIAVVSSLGM